MLTAYCTRDKCGTKEITHIKKEREIFIRRRWKMAKEP